MWHVIFGHVGMEFTKAFARWRWLEVKHLLLSRALRYVKHVVLKENLLNTL